MKDNLSLIFLFISIAQPIYAIEFKDATEQAGINYNAYSFGSSCRRGFTGSQPELGTRAARRLLSRAGLERAIRER